MVHPKSTSFSKLLPGLAFAALFALAGDAVAQWTADPATSVEVVDQPFSQTSTVATSDGADGVFVAWHGAGGGAPDSNIFLQRIDATGQRQWEPEGRTICAATGTQNFAVVTGDGAGGAFVGWRDARDGGVGYFVQRVDADGMALWEADGVEIVWDLPGGITSGDLVLVADGTGGVIAGWAQGFGGGTFQIRAQRFDAGGVPQWAAGDVLLCDQPNTRNQVRAVTDGAGGAILVWTDGRAVFNPKIYANRVSSTGAVLWATDGIAISFDGTDQRSPTLVSDDNGGAFAAWQDYRVAASLGINLYAQHLFPDGSLAWGADGADLCLAPNTQGGPDSCLGTDGLPIFAWADGRTGSDRAYAQKLALDGSSLWAPDGVELAPSTVTQNGVRIAPDAAAGAWILWQEDFDLRTQRVDAGGAPIGSVAGDLLSSALGWEYTIALVSTSDGFPIGVWSVSNDNAFADKVAAPLPAFVRGDANADGTADISDASFTLSYVVGIGPAPTCLDAADTNDSGAVDIADAVYQLAFLFVLGSPEPPAPFGSCGPDPTADPLGCSAYAPCP